MGDRIDILPTDETTIPSKSDIDILSSLFKKEEVKKVAHEFKHSVIGGVLFLLLSSPMSDKLLQSAGVQNPLYGWGIKFLLFIVLFYILKNRF